MDPASLATWGLLGLFFAAFLAGGILPFPSEPVLSLLLEAGADPWGCVLAATLGNVAGALTLFAIGWAISRGGRLGERLQAKRSPEELERARERIERFGPPTLILAWLPVVGDALPLGAGLARLPLASCTLWLTIGKCGRYVVWVTLHGYVFG